jgi:hypothetical protein
MADPTATPTGIDFSNLIGSGLSLGGLGLGAYNQQQQYNLLQGALKTIGPTSLNGYSLAGPGGLSSGYNPNGSGSISLGSLNPSYGNLASAAGGSSAAYNPGLLAGLTGNAAGTLGLSTGALTGAYSNYNAGMGAANAQLGNLGDFGTNYNNLLSAFRAQSAPGVQQAAYGLQNTLFGNGVADSTGAASGSLAAQNFGRGVAQADSTNQLNAFQAALGQQQAAASNYGTLTSSANGLLTSALNNFGNTNQLISGLNTASLNNSLSAIQGAGALNTLGLNNYNAALQTGAAQATARNQSLFPYASVATSLAGTPNANSIFANGLSTAGSSLSGNNSGLSGLFSQLLNKGGNSLINSGLNSLFGGTGFALDSGLQSGALNGISDTVGSTVASDSAGIAAGNDAWLGSLGDSSAGFSAAGGGAAAAGTAGAGDAALSTVGTGAVDSAADSMAASAASELGAEGGSDAGASTVGLGVGLGGAAALAGVLAPAIIGMSTPAFSLKASWWNNLQNNLNSSDPNTAAVARATLAQQAVTDPQAQALAAQYGITPLIPYASGTNYGGTGSGPNRNRMKA